MILCICTLYFIFCSPCHLLFCVICVFFLKSSTSQGSKFALGSLWSSLAGFKPSNLEQGRPWKSLSRRIHLSNPQASHFITSSLKACLMCCSKWGIALVDHHHTILCLPKANRGLSILVKPVPVYIYFFWVSLQAKLFWIRQPTSFLEEGNWKYKFPSLHIQNDAWFSVIAYFWNIVVRCHVCWQVRVSTLYAL